MAASDNIARAIDNYSRILVMVTEIVAGISVGTNPTQTQIDNLVAAATTNNVVSPKLDYSANGKSYQWTAYQEMIGRQIEQLRKVQILLAGPFEERSTGLY